MLQPVSATPTAECHTVAYWQSQIDAMPALQHSAFRVHYDADGWCVHAPLATHENDKACAFGGSLASLMTLTGWLHTNRILADVGLSPDVYVQRSAMHFLHPVSCDLVARARPNDDADITKFLRCLQQRGRGRLHVHAELHNEHGKVATVFEGSYVAVSK